MHLTKLTDQLTSIYKVINSNFLISGISCDSREIRKGMIFAAVNGTKRKGINFLNQALKQGASAVLCDKKDAKKIKEKKINILVSDNIRLAISNIANKFYPLQPSVIVGVTGTNGKTTIVNFLRNIWINNNFNGASIGTLGIQYNRYNKQTKLTTLDPINLHKEITKLKKKKIDFLALEASSHALDQHRLDNLRIKYAVFTNLSRDHLDYHKSMEKYFLSKFRLFKFILNKKGLALINTDNIYGKKLKNLCLDNNIKNISYGKDKENDWQILSAKKLKNSTKVKFRKEKKIYEFECLLFADFEIENLFCSMILANITGISLVNILKGIKKIKRPQGRLNKVKVLKSDINVFIDYAHTPEALKSCLISLKKELKKQGKLILLFGCGGNRDTGKRKLMGKIAEKYADEVFITDDNPRYESAKNIRSEISKYCKKSIDIANRKKAIKKAINVMKEEDILLIAGKGHEKNQIIKGKYYPFDDEIIARNAILKRDLL